MSWLKMAIFPNHPCRGTTTAEPLRKATARMQEGLQAIPFFRYLADTTIYPPERRMRIVNRIHAISNDLSRGFVFF